MAGCSACCVLSWARPARSWTGGTTFGQAGHLMTRRARALDPPRIAACGPMAGVTRWLLVLFLLSFAAPTVETIAARAAAAGSMLVELCTVDGVRQVALDRAGHPIDRDVP